MKVVDGITQLSWWDVVANFIRGGKPPPAKRWTPTFVLNLVSGTALVMIVSIQWCTANYAIGLTFHDVKCMPGTVYWIAKEPLEIEDLQRGNIYSYRAEHLMPLVPDGQLMGKVAAALPGDRVDVDANGIRINGSKWGDLNAIVLQKSGLSVKDVTRSFVIAKAEVLMLGTLERSYDGRYWGPVKSKQLVGRTWRLW